MKTLIVIPARMASTRFPGKPLVDLCGKPMIQWVVEAAQRAAIGDVIVATPDQEIIAACKAFHAEAILTRIDHPSGTDRIAEVSESLIADVYVNVQGDEPLIPPETIQACVAPFSLALSKGEGRGEGSDVANVCECIPKGEGSPAANEIIQMTSLYAPCLKNEEENPAAVKVVTGQNNNALYFSRFPIPYSRAERTEPLKKHIGIYAYRREVVQSFARWSQTPLEIAEGLEQLRFLENGIQIRMSQAASTPQAVDTPAQAEEVRIELEKIKFES